MARIAEPDPASLPAEVRAALAALPRLSHFTLLAHAETAFLPRLAYGEALMRRLALPSSVRELAILRAARLAGCAYIQVQHRGPARQAGVSDARIDAVLASDLDRTAFSPAEAAALTVVEEMVTRHGAGGPAVRGMLAHFSTRELVELALVVERYLGLAMVLNSLGVQAEAPRELTPAPIPAAGDGQPAAASGG